MTTNNDTLRILVVDDETFILGIIVKLLNKLGYANVTTAMDGSSALTKLVTAAPPFDLILSDLNMPKMDGVEFLRRAHEAKFAGGVILLSAEGVSMLESAFHLGSAQKLNLLGAIPKPVDADALDKLIQKFLQTRRQNRAIYNVAPVDLDELKTGVRRSSSTLLQIYYQPIINVQNRKVSRLEVLLRWNDPNRGMLSPAAVLSVAAENGMLRELTEVIIDRALVEVSAWLSGVEARRISFNVPATLLLDNEFIEKLLHSISQHGVEPSQVLLEVPAAELLTDSAELQEAVMRLRMKRLNVSVEDFGAGSYSLTTLKRFPVAEIKIDKAFASGAVDNSGAKAILAASVAIAKNLGVKTVAQCAEIESDIELARNSGIDFVQGFLLARPMPREKLMQFLADN